MFTLCRNNGIRPDSQERALSTGTKALVHLKNECKQHSLQGGVRPLRRMVAVAIDMRSSIAGSGYRWETPQIARHPGTLGRLLEQIAATGCGGRAVTFKGFDDVSACAPTVYLIGSVNKSL